MKVQVEIVEEQKEPTIVIQCQQIDESILQLQSLIQKALAKAPNISFFQEGKEFYLSLNKILFFETDETIVYAHTTDQVYKVRERLYELEQCLPDDFFRISKSTILNLNQVYSIECNLTSYRLVEFYKSHKKVYVSRFYYKNLKHKLEKRRTL